MWKTEGVEHGINGWFEQAAHKLWHREPAQEKVACCLGDTLVAPGIAKVLVFVVDAELFEGFVNGYMIFCGIELLNTLRLSYRPMGLSSFARLTLKFSICPL